MQEGDYKINRIKENEPYGGIIELKSSSEVSSITSI